MGTLPGKIPIGEQLRGTVQPKQKIDGSTSSPIPISYRFPEQDEVNQILENQPIKGLQMDKFSGVFYTSSPVTIRGSYDLLLETEPRSRKTVQVFYDYRNTRRDTMRMKDVGDKDIFLGKLVTFE